MIHWKYQFDHKDCAYQLINLFIHPHVIEHVYIHDRIRLWSSSCRKEVKKQMKMWSDGKDVAPNRCALLPNAHFLQLNSPYNVLHTTD